MMGKRLKEIFGLILINITLVSGSLNAETVYADTQAKICLLYTSDAADEL